MGMLGDSFFQMSWASFISPFFKRKTLGSRGLRVVIVVSPIVSLVVGVEKGMRDDDHLVVGLFGHDFIAQQV